MDPYEHTELPEMVQIAIFPRLSDNILLESQTTSVLKMKVNGNCLKHLEKTNLNGVVVPLRKFEKMGEGGVLRSSGTEVELKQEECGWSRVDGRWGDNVLCKI